MFQTCSMKVLDPGSFDFFFFLIGGFCEECPSPQPRPANTGTRRVQGAGPVGELLASVEVDSSSTDCTVQGASYDLSLLTQLWGFFHLPPSLLHLTAQAVEDLDWAFF